MLPPCWKRLPAGTEHPHHPLKKVREAAQRPKQVKSESYSVKAFADDVTLFSTSKEAHQTVLLELDDKCSEIGLQIRPDKCVSYIFDGQKICSGTTVKSQQGSTKNMTSAPSKFLGQTLAAISRSNRSLSKKITEKVYSAFNQIDQGPIRGEYKAWIYKFYLVPSLFFNLAFDHIPKSTINKIQSRASSFLKRWLNIPKCATLASLFHPEVKKIPYLPHVCVKAKLRLLASVHVSKDLNIKEMQGQISDPAFEKRECIPPGCLNILPADPTSTPPTVLVRFLMKSFNNTLIWQHTNNWNSHVESLSVESKLQDIVCVENQTPVWSRIMFSLPAGQMSHDLSRN